LLPECAPGSQSFHTGNFPQSFELLFRGRISVTLFLSLLTFNVVLFIPRRINLLPRSVSVEKAGKLMKACDRTVDKA
jgi:hypothetical protein